MKNVVIVIVIATFLFVAGGTLALWADGAGVVGWRQNGTGCYPEASPPIQWELKEDGSSKNILWKTKLPCYSWAMPIVVGDKVFTRSEPYDLICLAKDTGKVLWIRSHPPVVAATAEEKDTPAFQEIASLVAELQQVNNAFVAQGWTRDLYKRKYDLQKKIDELTTAADEKYKLPRDQWVESWSGYTAATPCSDGKCVYILSGSGINACYDLDGNLIWANFESRVPGWGEHGEACSPALVDGKLIGPTRSNGNEVFALDAATGKEVWRVKAPGGNEAGAITPLVVAGVHYVLAWNRILRVSDGKNMCDAKRLSFPAAVAGNEGYYALIQGWSATWVPLVADGDKLQAGKGVTVPLPINEDPKLRWEPVNIYVAAPLVYDGLLYSMNVGARYCVADMANGKLVLHERCLPFDRKNPPGRKTPGVGPVASPILAGKHIYLMDNAGCTLVLEPGREFKVVAKNTIDYTVPDGWEPRHWQGPHHETTLATPIVDGNRIYIRGEQFLYCIGEK